MSPMMDAHPNEAKYCKSTRRLIEEHPHQISWASYMYNRRCVFFSLQYKESERKVINIRLFKTHLDWKDPKLKTLLQVNKRTKFGFELRKKNHDKHMVEGYLIVEGICNQTNWYSRWKIKNKFM